MEVTRVDCGYVLPHKLGVGILQLYLPTSGNSLCCQSLTCLTSGCRRQIHIAFFHFIHCKHVLCNLVTCVVVFVKVQGLVHDCAQCYVKMVDINSGWFSSTNSTFVYFSSLNLEFPDYIPANLLQRSELWKGGIVRRNKDEIVGISFLLFYPS